MIAARPRGGWIIAGTFFLSLIMAGIPLPAPTALWRPEWPALVLIYWCVTVPERVGIGIGWLLGCLQDALLGTLLGAHGLAYALAAYLTHCFQRRLRVLPVWQQALMVLALLALVKSVLLVVRELSGAIAVDWRFWLPSLTGAAVWPAVFAILSGLRRAYQVQ